MKYGPATTVFSHEVHFVMNCSACGLNLSDIIRSKPKYCPNCGHKFLRKKDSLSCDLLADILNKARKTEGAK